MPRPSLPITWPIWNLMMSPGLQLQFSLISSYAGSKTDRVTLLSCRTQAFLMALSSTSLSEPCYTFIHSWLLSMVWLVGLVLAKLQTGRLKIALFEAMFFRNKITINDDSVWVTHVDAHGKGLFSDETAWNQGTKGGFSIACIRHSNTFNLRDLAQCKGLLVFEGSEGTTTRLVTSTKSWPMSLAVGETVSHGALPLLFLKDWLYSLDLWIFQSCP